MAPKLPQRVDTVIIGNGPSALVLSYILHGHIPYYIGGHHDPILDQKLSKNPNLLHLTPDLYAHFLSSLRYSTAALPVNTLLDTLIRPNADTEINPTACIEWRYEPEKAVSHIAIGDASQPGGQWAEDPGSASAYIGTLSYAEQLSLPGHSYEDYLAKRGKAGQCDFVRPSRIKVADYLRAYPKAVGISDAVYTDTKADRVYRTSDGFIIGSLGLRCKHLVLATGIFTVNIPPPPLLAPISRLDDTTCNKPLLVVGSGFSAADVIISAPLNRKIIHVYQWAPESRPSPLRGCHQSAYPEYATIYKQMKLAAISSQKPVPGRSPMPRRKSNSFFQKRDWASLYKGLPNAEIMNVSLEADSATVTIRLTSGEELNCEVGGLAYVVGRRGSLNYLSPDLQAEILRTSNGPSGSVISETLISGRTLRPRVESSLEVAKNVFVVGSLAGDSLIRHAVGGCVFAAGRILNAIPSLYSPSNSSSASPLSSSPRSASPSLESESLPHASMTAQEQGNASNVANGHEDLHLDRRKLTRAVEVASAENTYWFNSGWWAGGLGPGKVDV